MYNTRDENTCGEHNLFSSFPACCVYLDRQMKDLLTIVHTVNVLHDIHCVKVFIQSTLRIIL